MSLLDILKQRKQQPLGPTSAGEIEKAQQTLATGKEQAPETGPAISNVQAQVAQQLGQAQQAQVEQQGLMEQRQIGEAEKAQQAEQALAQQQQQQRLIQAQQDLITRQTIADQQRQAQEQQASARLQASEHLGSQKITSDYSNRLKDISQARNISEQDIFADARQARQQLGLDNYKAYLEQVAHSAALSDRRYVDALNRIGQERNLQNSIDFRREANRVAFGQDLQILQQSLDMDRLMGEDARASREELSKIDLNTAINLAMQAAKEQAYINIIQGTTKVAGAATDALLTPSKTETK